MTGANHTSLVEAQRNYETFGACERRVLQYVRLPHPDEPREICWRPVDPDTDTVEDPVTDQDIGLMYPAANTGLYYWRSTYWQRKPDR